MLERRPAAIGDGTFLRALFATTRPDVSSWDEATRETFLDLQFRAQRQEWESRFPDSVHQLILLDGRSVGRAWVAWEPGECVFVDMTLLPEHRRSGLGSQVMGSVLAEADRRGVPVRVTIERTNTPSLTFVGNFGFEVVAEDPVYVVLTRPVSKDRRLQGSR